jgi:hypothetical protein
LSPSLGFHGLQVWEINPSVEDSSRFAWFFFSFLSSCFFFLYDFSLISKITQVILGFLICHTLLNLAFFKKILLTKLN